MKEAITPEYPATVTVDLNALADNAARLRTLAGDAQFMAVVKANGYGMGRTRVAQTLWDEGVRWFGVARVPEAIALRRALTDYGADPSEARILTWLNIPDGDWDEALSFDLDVSVSTVEQLGQVVRAVEHLDAKKPARIHLKVDTGMSRGGATTEELSGLAQAAAEAEREGMVEVVGLWSHMARADDPSPEGQEFTRSQIEKFETASATVERAGLKPQLRHLSATAGTLWHPDAHYDMVRVGIGLYGLSPNAEVADSAELGLKPVGALRTVIGQVKQLEPGTPVSYAGTWMAPDLHWVGLLPVGYQDGVTRALSNVGSVGVETEDGPVLTNIVGRVCMDQTIIDLGNGPQPLAPPGSIATLFGDPQRGEPSVDDWADKVGTINYEVVSRLPLHLHRSFGSKENL